MTIGMLILAVLVWNLGVGPWVMIGLHTVAFRLFSRRLQFYRWQWKDGLFAAFLSWAIFTLLYLSAYFILRLWNTPFGGCQ
jgi:hypothetical protein